MPTDNPRLPETAETRLLLDAFCQASHDALAATEADQPAARAVRKTAQDAYFRARYELQRANCSLIQR